MKEAAACANEAGQELYVYYRLRAEQAQAARTCFDAARGEAPVRLLQRHDHDPSLLTWMEVYRGHGTEALEQRIAGAMAAYAQGPRHRECFVPLVG